MTAYPSGASAGAAATPSLRAVSLRGAWRLAGLLLVVGAASTLPASFLLASEPEPWAYGLVGLALLAGLACLLLPWWRISERWLAVPPVLATLLVAVAISGTHEVFTCLYFLAGLFVGLVFPQPRRMVPFLVLIVAALLAPLAYSDEPARVTLLWAVTAGPGVILISLVVGRLTAGLEESREAYRQLSSEDGLTGVGNYRSLIERLRHETARHERRRREFALLTLDLDNFKTVNETQGHLVGDLVLAIIGSMLDLKVRTEDAVFRQGGDEFAVVAPETDRDAAGHLAKRIEHSVSRVSSGELRLSASIGCAVYPGDGDEPAELLDSADAALLRRKRRAAHA